MNGDGGDLDWVASIAGRELAGRALGVAEAAVGGAASGVEAAAVLCMDGEGYVREKGVLAASSGPSSSPEMW